MTDIDINFSKIEKKWQKAWEDAEIFVVKEGGEKKNKFYVCDMFPYPSGDYLHLGHLRNYCIGDLIARYKRMRGFNVLYPVGFDSFGLPAENAAIKDKVHPKIYTEKAIRTIRKMMRSIGLSYDWSREIITCYPEYYKWNQWIFLRMFEKGIAYRKKAPVNWCPRCETVLANEEALGGVCWRCDSPVTLKHLEQWFLKITSYAEELLSGLEKLDWPERVKDLQRNWIGKSYGTKIIFPIEGINDFVEIFTTRADTLYGVSFLAYSIQNNLVYNLVKGTKYENSYHSFLKKSTVSEKIEVEKERDGFFTGRYAIHPLTGDKIPIYAGNFVLSDYGTGVVMGVPAHDQRDFEFAKKYNLPIKIVVHPKNSKLEIKKMQKAFIEDGILINSDAFNGLESHIARERITELLVKKGAGEKSTQYKLRDWLISRQRYWGTPIPIVYCDSCGVVPVPEKQLPVLLPNKVKFDGKGNPLEKNEKFVKTICPCCSGEAKRETDTMATFFDSSWYYLRYCSPNSLDIFDRKNVEYWMPIDQYIGGIEHAVLHLLYARFFTKFLRDIGWITFDEPFKKLFNQGILYRHGQKMSKSKGNTITTEESSKKFGIDVVRLYLMFVSSPEKDMEWNDSGIDSSARLVKRFISLFDRVGGNADALTEHKLYKTMKIIEKSYDNFEFNKAIISFIELVNFLNEKDKISRKVLENIALMICPIMPHIAEEMWNKLGHVRFISLESWPKLDESKINPNFDEMEKRLEKLVEDIKSVIKIVKEKKGHINKIYLYSLPDELMQYDSHQLSNKVGVEVIVFAVNDKNKYDPVGKSSKVKPGRPAIYAE